MKKITRLFALLLAVFLLVMVFVMLYMAVTGSPYFMAAVYVTIGFPLLIYVFFFIYRLMHPRDGDNRDEEP